MNEKFQAAGEAPPHIVKGARDILAQIEATYVPEHEYVSVRESDYGHLDLGFYRRGRASLEAEGFVFLEDSEDLTLAKVPGQPFQPVMIRALASGDGSIMAGLYHPKARAWWMRLLLWVTRQKLGPTADLETEFSDGSFVCTTNAAMAAALDSPALIATETLPAGTSVERLLARHRERVAAWLARGGGIVARRVTGISELRAAQNRMNGIKAAHRGKIGGITREELERLSRGKEALAAEVHAEVRRQNAGQGRG